MNGPLHDDVDERLCDWVDGRMTERERERFAAELRVNAGLRQQLAEYERTVAAIRAALQAPTTPVPMADRVIAALATQQNRSAQPIVAMPWRGRSWSHLGFCAASAAALLLLALWIDSWAGRMPQKSLVSSADVAASEAGETGVAGNHGGDGGAGAASATGASVPGGDPTGENAEPGETMPRERLGAPKPAAPPPAAARRDTAPTRSPDVVSLAPAAPADKAGAESGGSAGGEPGDSDAVPDASRGQPRAEGVPAPTVSGGLVPPAPSPGGVSAPSPSTSQEPPTAGGALDPNGAARASGGPEALVLEDAEPWPELTIVGVRPPRGALSESSRFFLGFVADGAAADASPADASPADASPAEHEEARKRTTNRGGDAPGDSKAKSDAGAAGAAAPRSAEQPQVKAPMSKDATPPAANPSAPTSKDLTPADLPGLMATFVRNAETTPASELQWPTARGGLVLRRLPTEGAAGETVWIAEGAPDELGLLLGQVGVVANEARWQVQPGEFAPELQRRLLAAEGSRPSVPRGGGAPNPVAGGRAPQGSGPSTAGPQPAGPGGGRVGRAMEKTAAEPAAGAALRRRVVLRFRLAP